MIYRDGPVIARRETSSKRSCTLRIVSTAVQPANRKRFELGAPVIDTLNLQLAHAAEAYVFEIRAEMFHSRKTLICGDS